MTDQETAVIDQHSTDSVAFKEAFTCSDEFYATLREKALEHIDTGDHRPDGPNVKPEDIQLRKFVWEDGVISFQATHPYITHEDEFDGEIYYDDGEPAVRGVGDGRELEENTGGDA